MPQPATSLTSSCHLEGAACSFPSEWSLTAPEKLHVVNNLPGPGTDETLKFAPSTGNVGVVFATGIFVPHDLTFLGPDGNLYVSSAVSDAVYRYNGTTGAFIDVFVSPGSGGVDGASAITFGPDHNLYVTSLFAHAVFRYDGMTGAFIDQFVSSGDGGLSLPSGMAFGPDGNLYVNTQTDLVISGGVGGAVLRFQGTSGEFIQRVCAPREWRTWPATKRAYLHWTRGNTKCSIGR